MSANAERIYRELRGNTEQAVCNKEAGCYSHLWGRDCWAVDSVLSLIECSIDEQMDRHNPQDPLFKVWKYCQDMREKNRIGDFPDTLEPLDVESVNHA
jgi:hypothetical protein